MFVGVPSHRGMPEKLRPNKTLHTYNLMVVYVYDRIHIISINKYATNALVPSSALFVIATQIAIVHVPRDRGCVNAILGLGILRGCSMHISMTTFASTCAFIIFIVIVGNYGYDLISCDINVVLDRVGQRSCFDWSDIKVSTLPKQTHIQYLCWFACLFTVDHLVEIFVHSYLCKTILKIKLHGYYVYNNQRWLPCRKTSTLRLCHFFSDWAFVLVDQSIRVVFFDRASQMVLLRNPQKWQLRPWRSRLALKSTVDTMDI